MKRTIGGKRIVVTGASGGIGRAIAENLAANGARVILAARNRDRLKELESSIRGNGGDAFVVPCDVTNPDDRQRLLAATVEHWGGLDGLINNAGVSAWGHFQTSNEALNRTIFEVNFFAPVELMRLCIPELTKGQQPFVLLSESHNLDALRREIIEIATQRQARAVDFRNHHLMAKPFGAGEQRQV